VARAWPPEPPRPELVRTPSGPFGWIDASLLHDGSLERLGPVGTAVLVLLALAADRRGASFYGRARMAQRLGLSPAEVDDALRRLLALGLVAHRPWRPGDPDGVWQLLPIPPTGSGPPTHRPAQRGPASVASVLAQLGLTPPIRATPPESRVS
jgi:hypothetical protein